MCFIKSSTFLILIAASAPSLAQQAQQPNIKMMWSCEAISESKDIKATLQVYDDGKETSQGNVSFGRIFGVVHGPIVHGFWIFCESRSSDLVGYITIEPDVSDSPTHDALWKHKFRLEVTTRPNVGYASSLGGITAFVGPMMKWNAHTNYGNPQLEVNSDDFIALAKGSEKLSVVAFDKHNKILWNREDPLPHRWGDVYEEVKKTVKQVNDKAANFRTACKEGEDDRGNIIVTSEVKK